MVTLVEGDRALATRITPERSSLDLAALNLAPGSHRRRKLRTGARPTGHLKDYTGWTHADGYADF